MAKYRKKPVVIEAEQYHHGSATKGVCSKADFYDGEPIAIDKYGNADAHVHTIHNNQAVRIVEGDWILPEPDGIHFYPCKPDIFEASYEQVE